MVAQEAEEDFRAFTEAPRLFLRPQRLRLLKRERERESIRWVQFESLVRGKAPMAESGFAYALFGAVAGSAEHCRLAERGVGRDLRQLALVYDWCGAAALMPALQAGADRLAGQTDLPSLRSRALAALALAEAHPTWSETTMRDIVVRCWRGYWAPRIRAGAPVPRADTYALLELVHAVRDNLNIDLRDPVQGFFRDLPVWHMLSYYPAAFSGPENEFRIPYYVEDGEPDLRLAALSRAAELAMVALENHSVESQALQSWLMQDRFLMRGVFGIPYEFLWANPYLPGITYHFLPNVFHDRRSGRLFLRSSWEEDATFFCYDRGRGQVFEAGKRADVNIAAQKGPVRIGTATILVGRSPMEFEVGFTASFQPEPGEKRPEETWFLVSLTPGQTYVIEPDDEEMMEMTADAGGILSLQFPRPRVMKVRIRDPWRGG